MVFQQNLCSVRTMPYTQSLLANGMAIGYHAKAAPPTVTMPRLKVGCWYNLLKYV